MIRTKFLLVLLVALIALSPALAGCYHGDEADDEPTPTDNGGGGGDDGDGY